MASGLPLRVRWTIDGQEFNGPPDDRGREWVIDAETGWSSSPPTRNDQTQPRTGAHGGWPGRTYRDSRTIRLDGWVYAPTWEARRDAEHRLSALCADPGREYPLMCAEETGDLIAHVTQDDTTLVTIRPGGHWLDFSLQLVAADPRKYGVAEQSAETGLPADSATGLDFGPQLVTGRATVTNTGTADTAPTLTLTGPLVPPITVTRPDNGARLAYLDSLDEDDELVIDVRRRTVQRGSGSCRHRTSVSDWDDFAIAPASTLDCVLGHAGHPNTTARLVVTCHTATW